MTQLRLVAVSSSPLFSSGRVASSLQNCYFYVTKLHIFYFLPLFAEFWTHFSKTLLHCYYLGLEWLVLRVYPCSSYSSSYVAACSSYVAFGRCQKWTATNKNIIKSRSYSNSSRVAVKKIDGQHVFSGCLVGLLDGVKVKNGLYCYFQFVSIFEILAFKSKSMCLCVLGPDWENSFRSGRMFWKSLK